MGGLSTDTQTINFIFAIIISEKNEAWEKFEWKVERGLVGKGGYLLHISMKLKIQMALKTQPEIGKR